MTRPSNTDSTVSEVRRADLLARYRRNRARTRQLFELLSEETYYEQPIALRHPIVFYEGHLPAFAFNTLVKRGLGEPGIDADLERLFARGIDPDDTAKNGQVARQAVGWPERDAVQAFVEEADRRIVHALANADLDRPGHPLLDRAEAVFAILEHEEMHQETLLYMLHRLPLDRKKAPGQYRPRIDGSVPAVDFAAVPAGRATLGVNRGAIPFAWDNECPAASEWVEAFAIERHNVTNYRFLEFVEAGGYRDPQWWTDENWQWVRADHRAHPEFWERDSARWFWRGMFERIPLPPAWPAFVRHAEASAFARWSGSRLPTEAEYQRAAYGSPAGERPHPWGDADPQTAHGAFDFSSWDPIPVGSRPAGASAWGIDDLVGNGWEWTSTTFRPFSGFQPLPSYPEYSADFFDGQHFVMKGASPATARELLRPTFRNWFRPRYPYVYATFRCVTSER
jgi:ergothioneine biosynthesis protein EgtB